VKRSRYVSLALVGLFLWGTACTRYQEVGLPAVVAYDEVRVTTKDRDKTLLFAPSVEGDELRGYSSRDAIANEEQRAIPIDAVARIEARQDDTVGTAALALLGLGLVVAVVATVDWDNSDTW